MFSWIVLIVVLCAAGVALIAGFVGWRHYRTKGKNSGGPWIIVSPNPDYLDTVKILTLIIFVKLFKSYGILYY